jgi:hypothetical protein
MNTMQLIAKEIASLPEPQQREVYDFVRFLRIKTQDEHFDGLLISEAVLARDWNTPDEDQAWASL